MKAGTRVIIESGARAGQRAVVTRERGLVIDCVTETGDQIAIAKLFVRKDEHQVRVQRRSHLP